MLYLMYGVIGYAAFLLTLLGAVCFVENVGFSKTIDIGHGLPFAQAIGVDVLLLMLFAVQHSVMARPWAKKMLRRVIPAPIERSTFVLAACAALMLLFRFWQPIGPAVWTVEHRILRILLVALSTAGFTFTVYASFLINHFELFGLRQVWLHYRGLAYQPPCFTSNRLYQYIRAPLMLGFLVAFWAAPTMTYGRLLMATISTVYVLVAVRWEEGDLAALMGEDYRRYRERTPMLLPWPRPRVRHVSPAPAVPATPGTPAPEPIELPRVA